VSYPFRLLEPKWNPMISTSYGAYFAAIQVLPVKNFQVFPGFTTAGICLKSRARVNGAIQSHFTFVEADLQQVCKIGRKR
jgi:hypothetical protein